MARPKRRVITSGIGAWDADVDSNFDMLANGPLPIYQVDTAGELPSATTYDNCFAFVGTGTSALLYFSNGTTWQIYQQAAYQADSTATDAAGLIVDYNILLGKLRDASIMAVA